MHTVNDVPRARHRTSLIAILAGTLVAFGSIAVLGALAAGVAGAVGIDLEGLTDDDWRNAGMGGAAVLAVALLLSFFFGGYTTGRMTGGSTVANGLLVTVLGLLLVAGIGATSAALTDADLLDSELRARGVPTSADDWRDIGVGAGVAAIAAMAIGSVLGTLKGTSTNRHLAVDLVAPAVERDREELLTEHHRPSVEEERAAARHDDAGDDAGDDGRDDDVTTTTGSATTGTIDLRQTYPAGHDESVEEERAHAGSGTRGFFRRGHH